MAYQKKYYFSFKDIRLTERTHLVELWQNTEDTLTAEEIKGHMNPFSVEMPEITNKFQVVRGNGCQINILSETDMQFFTGLYHVNPTDFMVKHYIDGVINFLGYLNAEMMSEPYDIDFNYQVSMTGNDGFSLMDRFSFIQTDETNYTGVKSKFELLQIIFAKIGLPFTEYRIALSTTFTGYSGATDSSILHESYISCANFYDEDDKPMSLREVVESILAPYGANIRAECGNIYITDIHSLASLSSVVYKRFTMSTGAYVADITIANQKAIADIGYMGTGHSIERSGGVNRQVVAYSPYPVKTILDQSITGLDEFETIPEDYSVRDEYNYKVLENNQYWEINPIYDLSLNPPVFELGYYDEIDQSNLYLRFPRYAGINNMIANLKTPKFINITGIKSNLIEGKEIISGVGLFLSCQILTQTKLNPFRTDVELPLNIISIGIKIKVSIGGLYYNNSTKQWTSTPYEFFTYSNLVDNSQINDRFVNFGVAGDGVLIPIGNLPTQTVLTGVFQIEIMSEYAAKSIFDTSNLVNKVGVMGIWIKDFSVTIRKYDGSEIKDNDIEYIGLLDRNFQNEGEKITLTCGTDSQFSDRGKILGTDGTDYFNVKEWTRNGQTFKIEELLLASVSSNYRAGFITLMNMKLKNSFSLQNILTDTFIGTAKMMVKSANINYQDNVIDCSLVEILPDELVIVRDSTVK